jgi:long-chain acyl-CoA synthetase
MSTLNRIFDLIFYQAEKYPKTDSLNAKVDGKWVNYSTQDVIDISHRISIGLYKLGIRKDDKVAIISENRPEWALVDLAIQYLGAISVPMYPTITIEDYRFIFKDAGVKIAFVSNQDLFNKVKAATSENPLQGVYSFNKLPSAPHWKEVEEKGKGEDVKLLDPFKKAVQNDDLLTLIYTSGTTGVPKGVMLSHKNVLSNVLASRGILPIADGSSRSLSFLPMCHIYERTGLYAYYFSGTSIYFAESMETIGANLLEVRPHMFYTVPRLLEKVYDKIVAKGYALTGIKKKLFFWALELGLRYDPPTDQGWWYNTQLKLANKLIFSKWREALGGNIQIITSGASALQPRLARVFWAAGIPVCEGYGLTETSPVIAANLAIREEIRIGTVGKILSGVEVKIAEDGEILCKGDNVMMGYYNQPQMTAEVIKNGWFHTGDIGVILEGKYLKITDRKKEMFKTSGGKYIAPQVMENRFKESVFIEQLMVVGDGQKFAGALIVPAFELSIKVMPKSFKITKLSSKYRKR